MVGGGEHEGTNSLGESLPPIEGASFPETRRFRGIKLVSARYVKRTERRFPSREEYPDWAEKDEEVMISLMLACAVLASLALGVLAAYGLCLGFFRVMQMRGPAASVARLEGGRAEAVSKL